MEKDTQGKILIVDDSSSVRRLIHDLLEEHGLQVICAENGEQAWQLFQQERPILILTDLQMPIMDGFDLLSKIMQTEPDIPVIVISGIGKKEDVLKALRLGAWNFLEKPFDVKILLHVVDKALDRQRLLALANNYQQLFEQSVSERTKELERIIEEKTKAEREIKQAKQEWERTVDSTSDLIALFDCNHRVLRMNKAMCKAFGMDLQEAAGKQLCLYKQHLADSDQKCLHEQVMTDGKPHNGELYDEQHDTHFEIQALPSLDPEGKEIIGSIFFARDISERKKAEKEKALLHSQLLQAQKLESVGQLAAGIAHEINTPTQYLGTNISFFGEAFQDFSRVVECLQGLIQEGKSKPECSRLLKKAEQLLTDIDWEYLAEEVPEAIKQSLVGVQKVTSIVQAMKKFSHPGGREKAPEDLNGIIETTVTISRNEWKYVAELETVLDASLPLVPCLRDEIGQVVLNIIVNSAHAIGIKLGETPSGDKGLITIRTAVVDEQAEIRISDTGTGMPEEVKKRIFDPFFTTKEVGRGTGQGLTISHNVIVNKHHGSIKVDTIPGQGTTFIIHLPLADKR